MTRSGPVAEAFEAKGMYVSPFDPLVTFMEHERDRPRAPDLAVIEGKAREALAVPGDTAVYQSKDARIERHGAKYVTSFYEYGHREHGTLVSALKTFLLSRRRRCWSCGQDGCGGANRKGFLVEPLPPEAFAEMAARYGEPVPLALSALVPSPSSDEEGS
jgi:hypothetical protein